jgi:nucleoside-diphosphate-sugar epimerase
MNTLVVGGAGYIGGAITDLLAEQGHTKFRVYDALLYEECYRKPVDFICGDVRDHERLLPHLGWADAVVWLAALVGDGACQLHQNISHDINQASVQWLTENFSGRILFTSTCSVYGAQEGVLDEASPLNPLSVYAATKLAAEEYLADANALIFRLGTLYGVGDIFSRIRLDLVVNMLTVHAARTGRITVFGGNQFRPLLHVRDAAAAIVDNLDGSQTGVFNLASQNVRIIDLAYQVRNHYPDLDVESAPMKFQDTRNYRVSAARAHHSLRFQPEYSIDYGIRQVKDLLATGRLRDVDNPRYTNQKYLATFNTHLEDRCKIPVFA